LAVDSDRGTWTRIKSHLEKKGYNLVIGCSAEDGFSLIEQKNIKLVLVDTNLPDADYLDFIKQIKAEHFLPIIVIGRQDHDETDRILGLEMGADDYLCKPFDVKELAARIKANLRLVRRIETKKEKELESESANIIHFGHWYLDLNRHELLDEEQNPLNMTAGEIEMLTALARSPRQTLTRDQLFDITRERDYEGFDRAVDVQISRIRQKIGDDKRDEPFIKTVRGVGYMLDTETEVIE